MSAATFTPAPGRASGATAITSTHHRHRLGEALRALKVYAGAAFDVIVLGEYGEEAGCPPQVTPARPAQLSASNSSASTIRYAYPCSARNRCRCAAKSWSMVSRATTE